MLENLPLDNSKQTDKLRLSMKNKVVSFLVASGIFLVIPVSSAFADTTITYTPQNTISISTFIETGGSTPCPSSTTGFWIWDGTGGWGSSTFEYHLPAPNTLPTTLNLSSLPTGEGGYAENFVIGNTYTFGVKCDDNNEMDTQVFTYTAGSTPTPTPVPATIAASPSSST